MLFAAYLATTPSRAGRHLRPRAASTIVSYVALTRAHLAAIGGYPLTAETPRWKRFVRGLRREFQSERRACSGLRASHLRAAFQDIEHGSSPRAAANEWAIAAAGWNMLARPRELSELSRSDISFADSPEPHAIVMLMPLKKKPGQTKVPVLIAAGDGSGADAYAALRLLVRLDPVPPGLATNTPLFRRPDGRAFSKTDIQRLVKRVAARAGESRLHTFTGRSLRVGGATDLQAAGVPASTIQLMGRWSSDIYAIYTRLCHSQVLNASRAMGRVADDSLEQRFPGYVQSARLGRPL